MTNNETIGVCIYFAVLSVPIGYMIREMIKSFIPTEETRLEKEIKLLRDKKRINNLKREKLELEIELGLK